MAIRICKERKKLLLSSNHLIVLGGPGSGKTTIALMKARREIESLSYGQKILFLSFARATVARVIENSSQCIDRTSLKFVEINTYHGFFWGILRSHGYLINKNYPFKIMTPADETVRMANTTSEDKKAKLKEIFESEGCLAFDLFASSTKELISESKKLRRIISKSYPIIIVDEFQDTNTEQWEIVKLLSENSRIIALADPNQRIYDFKGADPARVEQFINQLNPEQFDFKNENNRSSNTDINIFGNDLITEENQGKEYNNVKVIFYPSYKKSCHKMYFLKEKAIEGIRRLKSTNNWSIAILLPTKLQMLQASNYFSSSEDKLPPVKHDVAIDAEGSELAGRLFAKLLEKTDSSEEIKKYIISHLIAHLKRGKPPTRVDLKLSTALEKFLNENKKITGKRRIQLLKEIDQISNKRTNVKLTGNPSEDWLNNLKLFNNATEKPLKNIREDAKYGVRLLRSGSHLRDMLSQSWRKYGYYRDASKIFHGVIQKENFSSTIKKPFKVNIMTIHKSKGKQFNEVFLFEGLHKGRFVRQPDDQKNIDQSRRILRVGVTRAMSRATILSPDKKQCEIL